MRGALSEYPMSELLDHQRTALEWLQHHYHVGSPGALLADDMGLGKTLVALAFLVWLRQGMANQRIPRKPILIVGPVGLLQNWRQEHHRHIESPGLGDVIEAFGSGLRTLRRDPARKQPELHAGSPTLRIDALTAADWVTTSYETLRDYQHSFGLIEWAAVRRGPTVIITRGRKRWEAAVPLYFQLLNP